MLLRMVVFGSGLLFASLTTLAAAETVQTFRSDNWPGLVLRVKSVPGSPLCWPFKATVRVSLLPGKSGSKDGR
jgi:hypothetical protein